MNINLIIDGNYMLSRLVFTLHKSNILYGALEQALNKTIDKYKSLYSFSNIYLVSDSKEKSWRKNLNKSYKSNRKKDTNIDWTFVYNTYDSFKESLTRVKVFEYPRVEGDDWISYLCEKSNSNAKSTIVISNDYDIKQLVKYNLDPLYINIMSNEMYNKKMVFLPKNYQILLDKVKSLSNDDIFNLNDNSSFIELINNFVTSYEVNEVDNIKSLVIKLISGDKSDNITSAWNKVSKTGRNIGIGKKGAENIYNSYLEEFGEIDINDSDFYENIADIICERKKISKTKIEKIADKINKNSKLIDLKIENIPNHLVENMNKIYKEYQNG